MHIKELHIDGFGIFIDLDLKDLPNGLVLLSGENESGKTTMMEFIRTMLFGFKRKGSHNDYPPLRGGEHGGKIQVIMQDGSNYVISQSRQTAKIVSPDGELSKEAFFDRYFKGIDRLTFERVFAIGLQELQGLDVLSQENVRTRLLSASSGLGIASVSDVMRNIDRELSALVKPHGKQQIINSLARELKEKEKEIKEIQSKPMEYAKCKLELDKLEQELTELRDKSLLIKRRLGHIGQLLQACDPWVKVCSAENNVKELEFAHNFPVNGLERFEDLKNEIEELKLEEGSLEIENNKINRKISNITIDSNILDQKENIERLYSEREKLASALEDYPRINKNMELSEDDLKRRLRELGKDWESQEVKEVDTSIQVRHYVQEIGNKINICERKRDQVSAKLENHTELVNELKMRLTEAQNSLNSLECCPSEQVGGNWALN